MSRVAVNPQNLPTGMKLRGALLDKGYTYEAFATEHDFCVSTVYAVAAGRRGIRAKGVSGLIRKKLAAILETPSS